MPVNILTMISLPFAFSLIGLSVYLTRHIIGVIDLTCDGSVALGGCLYGILVLIGVHPVVAFISSGFVGAIAGFITSYLRSYTKVAVPIAGLITLSTINTFLLKITEAGKLHLTNLGLAKVNHSAFAGHLIVIVVAIVTAIVFYRIINSEYGLSIRTFRDGRIISESLGIECKSILNSVLGFANALAACGGALITHICGEFSATMGTGSIVFGMVAILLGTRIVEPVNLKKAVIGCFFGAVIFKFIIEITTAFDGGKVTSEYHSLLSAVILIFLIASEQDEDPKRHLEDY